MVSDSAPTPAVKNSGCTYGQSCVEYVMRHGNCSGCKLWSTTKLKFSYTIINSTHINTFTMELILFEQLIVCISCSLCTVSDRAACVACHITMVVNFVAKMLILCSYCT